MALAGFRRFFGMASAVALPEPIREQRTLSEAKPAPEVTPEMARAFETAGDWQSSHDIWDLLRLTAPNDVVAIHGKAVSLRKLRRLEDAENFLSAACEALPAATTLFIERAILAEERLDYEAALERWAWLRDRFPADPRWIAGVTRSLRLLGRIHEAEKAIEPGLARSPANRALLMEFAALAEKRGDDEKAALRWAEVRLRHPVFEPGYTAGTVPLRRLKRYDEAEQVLRQAIEQFPSSAQPAMDFARVAEERGDFPEARSRWAASRLRFPAVPQIRIAEADLCAKLGDLDSAKALAEAALRQFPDNKVLTARLSSWHKGEQGSEARKEGVADIRAAAQRAAKLQNWEQALALNEVLIDKVPDQVGYYLGAAFALRMLKRTDDAEVLLLTAERKFPEASQISTDLARISMDRRDFATALERWHHAAKLRPDLAPSWSGIPATLRGMRRYDDAEAASSDLIARFPDDPTGYAERANVATDRCQWEEAAKRWETVRTKFPNFRPAYTATSWPLRQLQRYHDAEEILIDATTRFPHFALAHAEFARIAEDRKDWQEAVQRWTRFRKLFPEDVLGFSGLAFAYESTGRYRDAEELLRNGLALFPGHETCLVAHARIASTLENWPEAVARWTHALELLPNSHLAKQGLGNARLLASLQNAMNLPENDIREPGKHRAFTGRGPSHSSSVRHEGDADKIMLRFESLGANCEFGLVQRHFGIEPLGLLRWTGVSPSNLIAALDSDLEGIGEPDFTQLYALDGEWVTSDTRWQMVMHTFIPSTAAYYEKLYPEICNRLRFLRQKLLEDLEDSEKIFTYQDPCGVMADDVSDLHRAIRRFGPSTFLCVNIETPDHQAGTVLSPRDGLLLGFVSRLGPVDRPGRPPGYFDIRYDDWLKVCTKALELIGN